ncbi:MAG: OmpA family protein [Acidobacteriota bacterium]
MSIRNGLLIVFALIVGIIFYALMTQMNQLQEEVVQVSRQMEETVQSVKAVAADTEAARRAAARAEENALLAARGRVEAEEAVVQAQEEATSTREQLQAAQDEARLAREETERIRKEREEELNRLQEALNRLVETRRTALGLVMNLGSDSIQFDFDKAGLHPEDRELLSKIAGILLTSKGYGVYVYGHTDDIGSEEYNQELSERRAQSVRDYLVASGIDADIISTEGYGKSRPLVLDASSEGRAKNRRVEIAIIDATVNYQGTANLE